MGSGGKFFMQKNFTSLYDTPHDACAQGRDTRVPGTVFAFLYRFFPSKQALVTKINPILVSI